jgi:hypothetical protein
MLSDTRQHPTSSPVSIEAAEDRASACDGLRTATSGLWRIGAFVVLVACLAFALDRLIDFGLQRIAVGEFGVWNRIVQGRINADIIISGSSRALTHYDPRVLQQTTGRSAFNIGLNGSQTDMQLARLKTYLRHNRKPQLVIHNLDAFSLQVTHGEVYDPSQYVPYLDEPALFEALSRVDRMTWKWRHLPLYGYATQDLRLNWMRGLRAWLVGEPANTHIDGYQPRHSAWTGEFEQFRIRHPNGLRVAVEPAGEQQLDELLSLCAEQNIRVVLSYSPEYLPVQAMTINRAEIMARFDALARRRGAVLLDFSASPISSQQSNFYNSQHLNVDGASAFSQELASRLSDLAAARR